MRLKLETNVFKTRLLYTLHLIRAVLDMMTIPFYLSVRIIENSNNRCSDNQDPLYMNEQSTDYAHFFLTNAVLLTQPYTFTQKSQKLTLF